MNLGHTRRAFLGLTAAGLALPVFAQAQNQAFIAPNGQGNGTSWEDAAPLAALHEMIRTVGAGGSVFLRADAGSYKIGDAIGVSSGGSANAYVRVIGVDGNLRPRRAQFVGSRRSWSKPSSIGGAVNAAEFGGNTFIRMGNGAKYVQFAHLSVSDFGRVFDFSDVSARGFQIMDLAFHNLRDGIYTNGGSQVHDVHILQMNGAGFSKKAIRIHGRCQNWIVENCQLDSAWQYGDRFAVGIEMYDQASNILISGGFASNCYDNNGNDAEKYWNGDGVASESNNRNIRILNHQSFGHSDGGYDLKSKATTLAGCVSKNNKRNYRIWGGGGSEQITMENCQSISPHRLGGIGGAHHIWAQGATDGQGRSADLRVVGGAFVGGEKDGIAVYVEGGRMTVQLVGTDLSRLESSMSPFKAEQETSKVIVG